MSTKSPNLPCPRPHPRPSRVVLMVITTLTLSLLLFLSLPSRSTSTILMGTTAPGFLAQSALTEILTRGAPILGSSIDEGVGALTEWMKSVPGGTKLVDMNLPGTHDTSTWNYTAETQSSLERYTGPLPPNTVFRCQHHSLYQMLNEGIRVFDLRYAYNPGNDTIGLHHSAALLAPTTSLSDVFFGLYTWLTRHPSETLLVSLNHESGTGTPDDAKLQEMVYDLFEGDVGRRMWVQQNATLPTLGEARGKLVLIQRFNYDLLPASLNKRIGIHLGPDQWTDNGERIEIVYNDDGGKAFIEDFYAIPTQPTTTDYILTKFNATTAHLALASSSSSPEGLYITFASAAWILDTDITPQVFALGDGTVKGMNDRLVEWLKGRRGRWGVVMLDFYDTPGLVEAVIGGSKGRL